MRRTKTTAWICALLLLGAAPLAVAGKSGSELFADNKCSTCHSIESEGIKATVKMEKMIGPDLGAYSPEKDTKVLFDFLTQAATIEDVKHKKKFAGTAEDLDAILAWLKTLEAAPAK